MTHDSPNQTPISALRWGTAVALIGVALVVTGCTQQATSAQVPAASSLPAAGSADGKVSEPAPASAAASASSSAGSAAPAASDAPGETAGASTAPGADPVPRGGPIVAVNDYLLPKGLGVWAPDEGNPSIVLDDLTPDIYFAGVQVDPISGEPTTQGGPEAIYRYDPTTHQATKVAGRSLNTAGVEWAGLSVTSATNGWFFWSETEVTKPDSSGDQKFRDLCFAAKSDGTQVITLADEVSMNSADAGWKTPRFRCGQAAGGGTMLWFGRQGTASTVHVFDTRTAQSKTLLDSAPSGVGVINGDTVLLTPDPDKDFTSALLIQVSSGTQTPWKVPAGTYQFALTNQALTWLTRTDSGTVVMGCPFDVSNPAVCTSPSKVGNWGQGGEGDGSGPVGAAGAYAVVRAPDPAPWTLVNVAHPSDKLELRGGLSYDAAAGNRLGAIWSAKRGDDGASATPRLSIYFRVITVKGSQ